MSIDTAAPAGAKVRTLGEDVAVIIRGEVERLRSLADGASDQYPHAALLGSIDTSRNRYVAIAAAEAALRAAHLPSGQGSLLQASEFDELAAAVEVLNAVRTTVLCILGGDAVVLVEEARKAAVRGMERELGTTSS